MKKILLLGNKGQVGRELSRSLLPLGDLITFSRNELDLTDLNNIYKIIEIVKPDFIVNAAAYTLVDQAETEKEKAITINGEAVKILANYALEKNCVLIHYSTDYVFDGEKKEPYTEKDETNPKNIYGYSKLLGEKAIIESGCKGYIFRTSWVYSYIGKNFVNTILKLAKKNNSLSIVNDQIGAPTSAEFISDITLLAILAIKKNQLETGIYNLTPSGTTTWYQLAIFILEYLEKNDINFILKSQKVNPIASEDYPLPALRPKNSVLNNSKIKVKLELIMPDWKIYIKRILNQLIHLEFQNEI